MGREVSEAAEMRGHDGGGWRVLSGSWVPQFPIHKMIADL